MERTLEREYEIHESGCPYCGCDKFDMHFSGYRTTQYKCNNPYCPSHGRMISLKEADRLCLPKKYADMRKEAFKLSEEIESVKGEIKVTQEEIDHIKRLECKKRSDNCLICKRRYEAVKRLELYDKKRNRLYTDRNPYSIEDPKTGKILEIGSINSKRRAKAVLSFRWFDAREKLAQSTGQLANARKELQQYRTNLEQLVARLNAIKNNRGLKKALAEQDKKKGGKV